MNFIALLDALRDSSRNKKVLNATKNRKKLEIIFSRAVYNYIFIYTIPNGACWSVALLFNLFICAITTRATNVISRDDLKQWKVKRNTPDVWVVAWSLKKVINWRSTRFVLQFSFLKVCSQSADPKSSSFKGLCTPHKINDLKNS